MVFAASKGRQSALESPDLGGGSGVFAHTIVNALGRKAKEADMNGNGFVEFMELVRYVGKSVNKDTEGDQTPWLSRKELFGDFAVAAVTEDGEKQAESPGQAALPEQSASRVSSDSQKSLDSSSPELLETISAIVRSYYDFVQKKDIDSALSLYASEKQPGIKRNVLETIAKYTDFFRVDEIKPEDSSNDAITANVKLHQKKVNKVEEDWEIHMLFIKEDGQWKIFDTQGMKINREILPLKSVIYMPKGDGCPSS